MKIAKYWAREDGQAMNPAGGKYDLTVYVIVALCASAVFLIASMCGLPRGIAAPLGALTGFVFRILTLKFNWRTRAVVPND